MPGFSSTDEEHREIAAYEGIILANTGVFSDMGLNRTLRGINPSYSALPLASTYSAVLGSTAVVLAALAKQR